MKKYNKNILYLIFYIISRLYVSQWVDYNIFSKVSLENEKAYSYIFFHPKSIFPASIRWLPVLVKKNISIFRCNKYFGLLFCETPNYAEQRTIRSKFILEIKKAKMNLFGPDIDNTIWSCFLSCNRKRFGGSSK